METDSVLGGCVRRWLCEVQGVEAGNDFDRFVQFTLTLYVARAWEVDMSVLNEESCKSINCVFS